MDKSLFGNQALGTLKAIKIQDTTDYAFNPFPLDENWEMPSELWPLLAKAKEELARLDGLGRHMPNYELLLRPLQQREALTSSSLEGTYATPEELLLFEIEPKEPKSAKDPVNSWKEVFNYTTALKMGEKLLSNIPISLRLFKLLHEELLKGVRGDSKNPGNFRKTQVHIGYDRRFIPPTPNKVMECLDQLEKYIHTEKKVDPLIACFMAHYQFETIHPFLDGNGRVGRLLLSLMIFQSCDLRSPWLYLSAYFERYKDDYIKTLFEVSSQGNWENWLKFCLTATIYQAKDAMKRCDQLVALKEYFAKKTTESGANIRLNKIIENLFYFPVFTIKQVSNWLEVTYPTAREDVKKLVTLGIITESGLKSGASKLFSVPDIIQIAYSNHFDE